MLNVQTSAARSTDDETSHLAAEEITKSGARQAQMERVVSMVQRTNGMTSGELAHLHSADRYMLARRLPEAETAQEIERGPSRMCGQSGRKALTWWVKGDAPKAF